jgi:GntR family transcriptional regulator, phosphonate transport system regulatory protein
MIQRDKGVAIWRQIAEDIQAGITRGNLSEGDRLPTEFELAERYDVNRHTVRRAIAALANDGYVAATRGRGTFVSQPPISYPLTARTRFSEIVSAQDLQPGGRLISSKEEAAEGEAAEKLGVSEGEKLIRLETLHVAEGVAISFGTSWFVAADLPNLIADYAETGSITKALEKAGFADYRRKASWISADIADANDSKYLRLEPGAAVLVVGSLNVTTNNKPLQFARARFVGNAIQLVVDS